MIYQWRKKLREDGDRVESLIPKFTSPKYPRRSMVPYEVIEFGKDLREKQPRLGKEKIKPLLDRYSEERGFSGISVSTIGNVIKRYFFSGIDIKSRSAYPLEIKVWQNDNGSENLGEFGEELRRDGVKQVFTYPRINGYLERYNRTVQEEFVDHNIDRGFSRIQPVTCGLLNILQHDQRAHKGIGDKSPAGYLIENHLMSQMSLTHTKV